MAKATPPATKADLDALESRLKLYFDVSVENLTANYRGIFKDRTVDLSNARENHEHRIKRLEDRVGMFS